MVNDLYKSSAVWIETITAWSVPLTDLTDKSNDFKDFAY